jgi:hypothetical protein
LSLWITVSVVALIPMLLRAPKALVPLRVDSGDPSRLSGLFRRYAIHTYTGFASDAGKRSDSYTSGNITSSSNSDGVVASVGGSIETQVVVTDRFFLDDGQGNTHPFEGSGFDARVGNGHLVSLAWVTHGFGRSGPYFLIYNQTTGETFFNEKAITKKITFPYPTLYIALLFLMILPIPVLILFALIERWQRFRFERAGVKPLLGALAAQAPSPEARPRSVEGALSSSAIAAANPVSESNDLAGALREVAALRSSGAISEAEFIAAKEKILRQG